MPPPDLRKPPPPPIRKGISQPQNPIEPSFLTTLPPEVRNAIYEFAFLREEPIVIVDAEEYERRPAWLGEGEDDIMTDEECSDLRSDEEPFKADEVDLPTSILRTCRQVYHEASGILYGSNTFTISVALHRHNPRFRQQRTAVRWILGIGSQFNLVAQIDIDVRPVCPAECNLNTGMFLLTGLIKLFWTRPQLSQRVNFKDSHTTLDTKLSNHPNVDPSLPQMQAASRTAMFLDNILASLFSNDALGLQAYSQYERLVGQIVIDSGLKEGCVQFLSSARPPFNQPNKVMPGDLCMPFVISSSGTNLQWSTPWRGQSRLLGLPMSILTAIIDHVSSSQDDIVFDLDARKTYGFDLKLCAINRSLRYSIIQAVPKNNHVYLQLTSRDVSTDFAMFEALRQWTQHPVRGFVTSTRRYNATKFFPIIRLNFDLDGGSGRPRTVTSLRVDVTELLRITFGMASNINVQIVLITRRHARKFETKKHFSLFSIRHSCFLLLSWLILQWPEKQFQSCPKIWIDGSGLAVKAVYSRGGYESDGTLRNPHRNLNAWQTLGVGMQYIGVIEHRRDPLSTRYCYPSYALQESDTLMAMWKSLRDLDWSWGDWC